MIALAARRLLRQIVPRLAAQQITRISGVHWAKEEVRAHLKRQRLNDEMHVMRRLEDEGSAACKIYKTLGLARSAAKVVSVALGGNRKGQMVFASIVCGTYFKHYGKEGNLVPVECPICGKANSLSRIFSHSAIGDPPGTAECEVHGEVLVRYLKKMVRTLAPPSPAIPLPMPTPQGSRCL